MTAYMQFVGAISIGAAFYVMICGMPPKYAAIPLTCAIGLLWISVPILIMCGKM